MSDLTVTALLEKIQQQPEKVAFSDVIATIDACYHYQPTAFSNGDVISNAGENVGSCKIFAFAQLQQLSEAQTLACFGHYYRDDVLAHPEGLDHANIRQFMLSGWSQLRFSGAALTAL